MFKFEIGTTVWYFVDGNMHSSKIISRMMLENCPTERTKSTEVYTTIHGTFSVKNIYRTKDEMLLAIF